MAVKVEYGYCDLYGWFKPFPKTGRNPRKYKTANEAPVSSMNNQSLLLALICDGAVIT